MLLLIKYLLITSNLTKNLTSTVQINQYLNNKNKKKTEKLYKFSIVQKFKRSDFLVIFHEITQKGGLYNNSVTYILYLHNVS